MLLGETASNCDGLVFAQSSVGTSARLTVERSSRPFGVGFARAVHHPGYAERIDLVDYTLQPLTIRDGPTQTPIDDKPENFYYIIIFIASPENDA
jgi:hypothetical protein